VIGQTDADLFGEEGVQFMHRDSEADRAGAASVHESRFTRPDGSECVLRTTRAGVPGENGRPALMLGMSEDVTQWRAAQERLAFLAGHDALTHLHNRVSFAERLEAALDGGAPAALLAIDLDRFKAVNDTHGHLAGDELLIAVAKLLREIGETDEAGGGIAARMAGDEFMLLVPGPRAGARAARIAQRLVDRLGASMELGPVSVRSGASIGIAVAPEHGRTAEELLRSADLALYRAKGAGRGRYSFFDNDMDEAARQRWRIEGWMREAIAAGQFRLEYQPLASLESGKVVAFEALARWRHPEGGDIRPDIFIPIAEESGLILELGRQMLRQAVAEAARWQPELTVSVNLSPIQVQNPVFYDHVAEALAEFGLAPERLELEVTEGVLIRDPEAALATLNRLKALGVSIAIDDFGTGYSSLSYFRMFPFDKVKIDQSFVREMEGSHEALAIVQAVIGLARGLGLPVVAEGVESQAQFDLLLAEGCTQVQGYLLGRPAPAEAFRGVVIRPDAEPVRATG
jgi:diguanylate cyclase (GGDEF)-like protein